MMNVDISLVYPEKESKKTSKAPSERHIYRNENKKQSAPSERHIYKKENKKTNRAPSERHIYRKESKKTNRAPEVAGYIEKQKEHHKIKTFQEEYRDFLKKFNIKYDEKYLFEFYE